MTEAPQTVSMTDTVGTAIQLLERLEIRHLPVLDEAGDLVGMLSDRDLRGVMGGVDEQRAPSSTARVQDVMSGEVLCANQDDDLVDIAEMMVDHRVGAIPIVDARGGLVGIVSYVDVLRSMVEARA